MLGYHRREENCGHWEFFRLHELDPEEMLGERKTICGLEFVGEVPGKGRLPTHRYRYPEQDTAIDSGKVYEVGNPSETLGKVARARHHRAGDRHQEDRRFRSIDTHSP